MILALPIFALVIGFLIALVVRTPITGIYSQYLAIACLAGLDTVTGGIRSGLEEKFRTDVFLSGFFVNTLIAYFLAWLGDQILMNMVLVVSLVLGGRIFNNLSLIRRFLITRVRESRERKKREDAARAVTAPG